MGRIVERGRIDPRESVQHVQTEMTAKAGVGRRASLAKAGSGSVSQQDGPHQLLRRSSSKPWLLREGLTQ